MQHKCNIKHIKWFSFIIRRTLMVFHNKIQNFEMKIKNFDKSLDQSVGWLLASAMACWGIGEDHLKVFGFSIIFIIFLVKLNDIKHDMGLNQMFKMEIDSLKTEIERLFFETPNYKKELLNELERINNVNFSTVGLLKRSLVFGLSLLFCFLSLVYHLPLFIKLIIEMSWKL